MAVPGVKLGEGGGGKLRAGEGAFGVLVGALGAGGGAGGCNWDLLDFEKLDCFFSRLTDELLYVRGRHGTAWRFDEAG